MSKVIGYMRVSTEEQKHDLQEDALWKHGCDEIYADKVSGVDFDRVNLTYALEALQPGDSFVVWKVDRLGRSALEVLQIGTELRERGIAFISITESFNTKTDVGWFVFQMFGSIGEMERKKMRERCLAGGQAARARGVKFGRPNTIPIGSPERRQARRHLNDGKSVRWVAEHLSVSKSAVGRLRKSLKLKETA